MKYALKLFFCFLAIFSTFFPMPVQSVTHRQRAAAKRKRVPRKRRKSKIPRRHKRVARKAFVRQVSSSLPFPKFSQTCSKFFGSTEDLNAATNFYMWEEVSTTPFNELILSWNAFRPSSGHISFYVSVKHSNWSPWHRLAEWGAERQRTFINKLNPYVHTKYVKVEMQRNILATGFRIKAVFSEGASKRSLNALFACLSNMKNFKQNKAAPAKPSVVVQGVPQQSQMILDHPRARDLCSPASTSMIVQYFAKKLYGNIGPLGMSDYVVDFADKVHDNGVDIYGNWLLNVAQAHDASNGNIFYRVERLNSFHELYDYLAKEIPVAVSVRRLKGGATPYSDGHFMVVVGWDKTTNKVICIDPAFRGNRRTLKRYKLRNFLNAWALSRNLSYIPMPKHAIWNWQKIS